MIEFRSAARFFGWAKGCFQPVETCTFNASPDMKQSPLHSLCSLRTLATLCVAVWAAQAWSGVVLAQTVHHFQHGHAPPGVLGQQQLLVDPSLQNYVQPVRLIGPEGCKIELWNGSEFVPAGESTATLPMSVGGIHRIKLTTMVVQEAVEVYPTIELLHRLFPPEGKADEFPVIVEIPVDDIEQAIAGKLVTRVVYLEDPETAMPYRQTATEQPYFDVRLGDDPLQAAYRLGRPFAMVRMGSRIPDREELQLGLGNFPVAPFGCPPDSFEWQGKRVASDEYIYDGGDRNGKTIVAADWKLRGLDTQDTIAHFDTLAGERVVTESNRVQIYAPRFAAVREISGAIAANSIDAAVAARRDAHDLEISQDQLSSTTLQNVQPRRHFNFQGANGLIHSTRGVTADNVWSPRSMSRVYKAYEDFQIIRTGTLENAETARLGIRIDAAQSWDSDLQVQIAEGRVKPLVVRDALVPAETATDGKPSRPMIRLYKVASTGYARPGDEVEFTIRFDNIGNEQVGNVTIVDNLTTRLEYIPDSAQCSKNAEFKTETNSGDSQTLRWEITDPLDAEDGGIIRFRCRVR